MSQKQDSYYKSFYLLEYKGKKEALLFIYTNLIRNVFFEISIYIA
mgnify:CR=1 FL=1